LTETVEPNRSKYHLTKPRTLSTLTALRAGAEDAEFFLLNKTAFSAPDAQRRCVFSVRGSG
jgi:hypothetical protein